MKTAILPGIRLAGMLSRAAIGCLAIAAMLAAVSAFASPVVKTLGGGTSGLYYGYYDTNTLQALFHTPMGLAADQSGEIFVADRDNNAVRELVDISGSQNGNTFTFAPNPYATNQLKSPVGVVLDEDGDVYVLNRGGTTGVNTNGTIWEYDTYGLLIATNATHLTNANAIAIDPSGNLYVTCRTNLVIEISSGGVQTLIAAVPYTNAMLQGIAVMPGGNLAVCDSSRDGIYKITGGVITTNAGFNGQGDYTGIDNQGYPAVDAPFFAPSGIAAAGDGSLIVSDYGNDRVKVITASGIVTNLYGVSSNDWNKSYYPGWVDGTVSVPDEPNGIAARSPMGVALSPDGTTVYTTEDYYHLVRMVTGGSFTAPPLAVPQPPTSLTGVIVTNSGSVTGITLTWNADNTGSDVTNYLVEETTAPGGGAPYTIVTNITATTFTYSPITAGATYYFVVQAENSGGESAYSSQISLTIPIEPPVPPTIGWYQIEPVVEGGVLVNGAVFTAFSPGTNNIFNNLISMAILPNAANISTYYINGAAPVTNNPTADSPNAPSFANDMTDPTPLAVTIEPDLAIAAINVNAEGEESAVASDQILFQCGNPVITGTNAAQFTLYDVTTNVTYYYTTDGSNPLTNSQAQVIVSTNGPVTVSINNSGTFTFSVVAEYSGFAPSAVETNLFLAQNFVANELTWGFQSGYCSSEFIASPGEIFYAPVTLTTLPGATMYGLEFDMVVTNLGPDLVPSGDFSFQSMLQEPETDSNTDTTVYYPIPPYMFIGDASSPPPPGSIRSWNGTNFVDLETYNTNLNELAVGWFEIYGRTNLFNTTSQNLLSYSLAFIQLIPGGSFPNDVIVGGYAFQVPTNAQPGEQYEIQLNRASANGDGYGGPNSAVVMSLPENGSLTNGAINATKIITVGQPKYMAGDVYPFHWFNAGDFGYGDLTNYAANDVEAIFNAAVYDINNPAANEPGSDFADAMDASGGYGAYDAAGGYWTNANLAADSAEENQLFNVNDATTINQMAFGDGQLDICDVFVTFARSQFPNLYWFQRFYTNDPVHGVFGRVAQAIYPQTNTYSAGITQPALQLVSPAVSITNKPSVHFAAGDYLASAGQIISIPITATVYGQNPMRMAMFNAAVVPLDGSPAVTSMINFSLASPFNNSSIYNQPDPGAGTESYSTTNFAAAIMPMTFPIPANAGVSGSNVVGYLSVPIPSNATSSSAYAVYFDHASASPNGLVSFPRTTLTGLITLSSRTNSYYNDGIPDSWRLRYFGTIYNQLSVSNADADGTGMNNWKKYQAGLNPEDSSSVLNEGLDQPMAQNQQDAVIDWPSVNGKTYIIERSSTLFPPHWTAISTNIGDGTYMEIHDTSGGGSRYYQVTTP